MIDAKDMARKALAECSHTVPVIIPCATCTEAHMRQWEEAVRHDTKRAMRDELRMMKEQSEKTEAEFKALNGTIARLKLVANSLESANDDLRRKLKAALEDASEARIQLHAEQTSHTFQKLVRE